MGRPCMHRTWRLYVSNIDAMAIMHNMSSFQHVVFSRSQCHGKHAHHVFFWRDDSQLAVATCGDRASRAAGQLDVVTCGDMTRWARVREKAPKLHRMILLISNLYMIDVLAQFVSNDKYILKGLLDRIFNYNFTYHFLTLWFYPYVLKMKQKFTPTLLCGVNGVKYNIKRQKCPCDFTPSSSFCDFTLVTILLCNYV
jgi:hypothetical protein